MKKLLGLVAAAGVGYVAGLLFAPKSRLWSWAPVISRSAVWPTAAFQKASVIIAAARRGLPPANR